MVINKISHFANCILGIAVFDEIEACTLLIFTGIYVASTTYILAFFNGRLRYVQVQEFARDGLSVAETTARGSRILGRNHVMPGVAEMIHELSIEACFDDGTKLVSCF